MNEQKPLFSIIITSIITALVMIGIFLVVIVAGKNTIRAFILGTNTNSPAILSGKAQVADSTVISVVKQTNPSVVSIIISKNEPIVQQDNSQNFFGDLFGNNNIFNTPTPTPSPNQKTQKQEIGGGSGFLISSDGMILTNNHVVSDPQAEYTVYTNDGKKHSAKVIAQDPLVDVAVIKIDGSNYPFLQFGDSSTLQQGQTVIAIGNALAQFRNTVSVGVVSGLSRSITAGSETGGAEQLDQVIQTDAAINPGNSGGPLIDLSGNVVGVNVAVVLGSSNIGFALPSNVVKKAVDSVKQHGRIIHPYLGVRYIPIDEFVKSQNNLSVDYGVLVQKGQTSNEPAVVPGSPADKAGIVENDIILSVDGITITNNGIDQLSSMIRNKNVGDTVTLVVLHKGQQKTVVVTLQEYPQQK